MGLLEDLYQDIILEHNKRPRNYGPLEEATHRAAGRNPLCGDELSVSLRLDGDRIRAVRFQGQGCAISRASASLMTTVLEGRSSAEAIGTIEAVLQGLQSDQATDFLEGRNDLVALGGVRRFPARIKCATLAWHAARCALKGGEAVTTELEA